MSVAETFVATALKTTLPLRPTPNPASLPSVGMLLLRALPGNLLHANRQLRVCFQGTQMRAKCGWASVSTAAGFCKIFIPWRTLLQLLFRLTLSTTH